MKTPQFLLIFSLFSIHHTAWSQDTHSTGATFNPATIAATPQKIGLSFRSFRGMPASCSLEPYCPTPGDQGNHGTCVAFANGYGIATILYAKTHNITDKAIINKYAFSPTFLYEQIKTVDDKNCQNGADPIKALLTMMEGGDALFTTVPYQCNTALSTSAKSEAKNYKIQDAAILFAGAGMMEGDKYLKDKQGIIDITKKALLEGTPVSTGWNLPESFFSIKTDVWNTTEADKRSDWKHNGHAMAVIGYDDNKAGGSFRVLNSWGTKWADGGLIWVKYDDYAKWCVLAIQVFPDLLSPVPTEKRDPKPSPAPAPGPAPKPSPGPAPAERKFVLSGNAEFRLNTGEEMSVNKTSSRNLTVENDSPPVKEELVAYTMQNSYSSNTRFRFYLNIDHEAYVYGFATDLTGKVNLILPFDDQVSTHVGAGSSIAFPSDSKVIQLDEQKGTDYLLILYSVEKLDAKSIAASMNTMKGALSDKIRTALGDKLIPKERIKYDPAKVAFSVNGSASRNLTVADDAQTKIAGGSVVPLMVEIKHN